MVKWWCKYPVIDKEEEIMLVNMEYAEEGQFHPSSVPEVITCIIQAAR